MLVRIEFMDGEFAHLNPDLIVSVHAAPDSYCADGPRVMVTMAGDTQWIIPGTVKEVLKKLGFSG
jgi:hypothetical protein